MKRIILSILLILSVLCGPAYAEYFTDIIVTSPNGLWTDERAYNSLADAIDAVGSNDRIIVVASNEVVTNLTVPSNVILEFKRGGMITYSGQLSINNPTIIAGNVQIFNATGAGEADFALGTNLRASWFEDLHEMFDQTVDNYVTCIVDRGWAANVDADCQVGNNVILKWEGPGNRIVINTGFTLSNIKNIEAGNYQLFAGSGDFDFLDGTELNLTWLNTLAEALVWIDTEDVTLVINDSITVPADVTFTDNITVKPARGAIISPAAGVTVTIEGDLIASHSQQYKSGDGVLRFSKFTEVTPENFGAKGDGSTNDYDAFLDALKSGCTLGAGVRILIDQKKTYVINNGSDPGILLDADNLPDPTVTATSNENVPKFEIVGMGAPSRFNPSGNAPEGSLMFTGTGNGIEFRSLTRKWRGTIRLENFNMVGGTSYTSRTANHGIYSVDGMDTHNIFKNLTIAYFSGDGFRTDNFSFYTNIVEQIDCIYNDGWGFRLKANEIEFVDCKALRNGLGGIYFETVTYVTFTGSAGGNQIPNILVGAAEMLSIDIYMEGALDINVPYTPSDGTGLGTIKFDSNSKHSIDIRCRYLQATLGGSTDHYTQYIIEFDGDPNVYNLDLDIFANSSFVDANGDTMAVVGPIGSGNTRNLGIKCQKQGATDLFADTDTENAFSFIRVSNDKYTRIKTLLPFCHTFSADNFTDDTTDQPMYHSAYGGTNADRSYLPWTASLVGFAYRLTNTTGSIVIHDATSGLSETIDATVGRTGSYKYPVGTYPAAVSFRPLADVADVGGNTQDIVIDFYFTLDMDEQNDDS